MTKKYNTGLYKPVLVIYKVYTIDEQKEKVIYKKEF